ncbi:MAG: uracil-DNA glycosylase [Mycoplasmataceae bacterium]|nr:uracil-DNA glycosylase [Mycoplasmataceae bacterium]
MSILPPKDWKKIYELSNTYPSKDKVFRCFNYFEPIKTKVVILGQDPYPTLGDANGLAFSVDRSDHLPSSLTNIFKELKNDLGINRINGDLSDWAKQGVLLLNTSLTFNKHKPELIKFWQPFIEDVIQYIDNLVKGVVFILWGNYAKAYLPLIKNNSQYVISSGHPSFAGVHGKFFNTKPFSKCNLILESINKTPIKW